MVNGLPHYSKTPIFKLVFSAGLFGNIEPEKYIFQCQPCSCESEEEHKAKWENYEITHPPQPLDFETIKERYNVNEKYLRHILNLTCEYKLKKAGRPKKANDTGKGRPHRLYQLSQKKIEVFQKEMIAFVCDYLKIKEKDFIKVIEENKELTDKFLESLILFSLSSSRVIENLHE